MPESVEAKAIAFVTEYFQMQGYNVDNVSKGKGPSSPHRGYDLVARKHAELIKIEVKGCSRRWGIPDPYVTEFDAEQHLVADLLCVVYFFDSGRQFLKIPRDAIKPEDIVEKRAYRFRSRFKSKKSLERYLVQIDD